MKRKFKFHLPEQIIDTHCHARDFLQAHITTIERTLIEAESGLIRSTAFMPNTIEPITTRNRLNAMLDKISQACEKHSIKFGQYVWFGATDNNQTERIGALNYPSVIGVKVYPLSKEGKGVTTGTIGVSKDKIIEKIIKEAVAVDKAVAFHCDDPEIIAKRGYCVEAVVEYTKKVIRIAYRIPKSKILICHVPCRESAELILQARKDGLNIMLELCPHYLWFDSDGTNWNPGLDSVFYHCFNNMFSINDREYLVGLLADPEAFVCIGSDNAPWTREEKLSNRKGGLPTNRHMVSVILSLARKHNIPESRINDLLCYNAASFLKINISSKKIRYAMVEALDEKTYNNGLIENPWRGSKLLVPLTNK